MIAIIAILAGLLLPALAQARRHGEGAVCISNQRQMVLAWRMYSDDNNDNLVLNNPHNYGGADGLRFPSWSLGDHKYGNPDGTNVALLMSNRVATLGNHLPNVRIFRCPSDRSKTALADGKSYPRLRSYSMNQHMGSGIQNAVGGEVFWKMGDWDRFQRPGWIVFMDTHADSIGTCSYYLKTSNSPVPCLLIKSVLGWEPATRLKDGMAKTYAWIYKEMMAKG